MMYYSYRAIMDMGKANLIEARCLKRNACIKAWQAPDVVAKIRRIVIINSIGKENSLHLNWKIASCRVRIGRCTLVQ